MTRTRGPSVKKELLFKSREAALNAIQTFNNPLTTFKTETFIVLMVIAWTYLLHAYYRQEGVEYRYYVMGPRDVSSIRQSLGLSSIGNLSVVSMRQDALSIDQRKATFDS